MTGSVRNLEIPHVHPNRIDPFCNPEHSPASDVRRSCSESQGIMTISISLACLGAAAILLGVLAWKATALMITKLNMNPVLAVTLTVAMAMLASGLLSFLSILVSIPLAGVE
jgi:hypothetical protein